MREAPSPGAKLFFWIILGCFSNYLAEGVSGAGLYPLLHPWWLFVCLPLYGLHLFALAYVVFRWGRPRLSVLLLAGFLFGMYEAYMTKVFWWPNWGPPILHLGGVAIVEALVISFFWHPVLAFVIPLVLGECLLTRSRECFRFLPRFLQEAFHGRAGLVVLAVACGGFQSYNSPSPLHSLGSGATSFGFIALILLLWSRWQGTRRWSLREMLPEPRAFFWMIAVLGTMYVSFGFGIAPDRIPGLGPQAIVWIIYAALGTLLYLGVERSRRMPVPAGRSPGKFSWTAFLAVALSLTLTSAALNLVPGRYHHVILAEFWVFAGVGAFLLVYSAADTLRRSSI